MTDLEQKKAVEDAALAFALVMLLGDADPAVALLAAKLASSLKVSLPPQSFTEMRFIANRKASAILGQIDRARLSAEAVTA